MKTAFDECVEAQPLRDQLWFHRGGPEFWALLQSCDERVRLQPPASAPAIDDLRRFAGGSLPSTLLAFFAHSNGLSFDCDQIVFSAEQVIQQTEQMRQFDNFMPFDHLLFIGTLGDGDKFAFGRTISGEWLQACISVPSLTPPQKRVNAADPFLAPISS